MTQVFRSITLFLITLLGACGLGDSASIAPSALAETRDKDVPDYLSFATDDEANTTEIFSKASPAVVFVTNKALRRGLFSLNVEEIPRGSGTGFVWNSQGLIVTNYHVIAGAQKLTVTLQDRSEYDAEVIGVAPEKDLAVLRIEGAPDDLQTLPLGDSSELQVGRKVLAIGNPFGLDTTLTTGIVSALGREIKAPSNRTIRGVIQTDAAINPGNSGGPLLNSMGQLIGVNTAIYSPSGASAGIGFAIPVNTVAEVVPQLISYGRVLRPVLGVELASDNWIRRYNIPGVPIVRLFPGLPADQAGMRGAYRNYRGDIALGDIITHINGERVRNNDEYYTQLERYQAGDTVTVTTLLGKEEREYEVRLEQSR
ncbi:S1C family serine protease [Aequoribacter sp.]|jgi:S1-C subfamily serine protease|uniref:S1C family serine protease n=1 Tax=Aequoribacter sp. TaxID=2847771 RepID=UPI003F6A2024